MKLEKNINYFPKKLEGLKNRFKFCIIRFIFPSPNTK